MATIRVNDGRIALLGIYHTNLALMGLFTAPSSPDATTLKSSIVEPSFPGYAQAAVVFHPPATIDANGNASLPADAITFTQSADASPQTVLGWFVWSGSSVLYDVKLFDSGPQVFQFLGDARTVNYTAYEGQLAPPL
jgi:hypothetical protein